MSASQYVQWTVTAGEQPTAAKWNILGTNDSSFNTGVGFNDNIVSWRHLATDLIPTGIIWQWAGSTVPSTAWLICDGSAVSRVTYSALFQVIGTTYGAGDNSTTFNLPNAAGKALVGLQSGNSNFGNLGQTGGEVSHTLNTNEMPIHSHGVSDPGHSHGLNFGGNSPVITSPGGTNNRVYTAGSGQQLQWGGVSVVGNGTGIWINNAGSGYAHNNLQPYLVTNYIIKT